ncbi:LOW QUALITY PROTEIN: hypothetical protein CVT25_012631 [Psilocybe cyanescens]|uniref:Uncharacterized protein n=1 Tax=Psilocybe cyanescens TaxID=93625 RepID=A0A409XV08_PSICY|nr:LOW QUALITY PROTEIN: hypothetical protein CVT25_012631 [Psilocybe cyanescens]
MGGEIGSNSAPQPNLEILPKPAGADTVINLDFLLKADPNNLYPFVIVLPSTKLFVVLAGRTYPLEGSAVPLPQHFSYTDPLQIFICGGSTNGAGDAIDNCVTIAPEAANSTWTLKRMPSKCVMPNLVSLPDGTVFIVNGATQGYAGFSLANNPNLNTVLYNPTWPLGSRFSILNNTIVARMYHSETNNPDGTVKYPEEFRVEVYIPPYSNQGLTPPNFTFTSNNWAYGSTNTIPNVKFFQGPISKLKVSLVSATLSTHGNAMGARTIFPQFSCPGTICMGYGYFPVTLYNALTCCLYPTGTVYSAHYISDRFLLDKTIDLVNEAASSLRLAQESKLEALDCEIMTLQIKLESLKKETDVLSVERRGKLEMELMAKRQQADELTTLWQTGASCKVFMRPIGDIIFGTAFFAGGQVLLFAFSVTICNAIKHYINELFFFSLRRLQSRCEVKDPFLAPSAGDYEEDTSSERYPNPPPLPGYPSSNGSIGDSTVFPAAGVWLWLQEMGHCSKKDLMTSASGYYVSVLTIENSRTALSQAAAKMAPPPHIILVRIQREPCYGLELVICAGQATEQCRAY